MQVDLLAQIDHSSSPFVYAGGNPVLFNDPFGDLYGISDVALNRAARNESNFGPGVNSWSEDGLDNPSGGGGGGSRGPVVYNKWDNSWVDAFEVIGFDPAHQNKDYRNAAFAAIERFYGIQNGSPAAVTVKSDATTSWSGC